MTLYEIFKACTGVTTDSRNIKEGALFFALKGDRFDGNKYAQMALESGANYAVIDNKDYYIDERTILVEDGLKALQQLALEHRKTLNIPVIGITGTNGKTTTKELVATVLQKKYNVLYTEGNLNNHIGVPLTLLRLTSEHQMAVVEMGANHPKEIEELVNIACPNYGLITNVGKAHLQGFGSFEGVKKTKGELYDYLRANHLKAFLNADSADLTAMAKGLETINYGSDEANFVSGKMGALNPFLAIVCRFQGMETTINSNLIGDYNLSNILSAVCIGAYFDISMDDIKEAIENYHPTNNRSQFVKTGSNNLIVDAYNANPSSMAAAITNFAALEFKNKALILGDMLELGEDSYAEHQKVVNLLSLSGFNDVFLIGENFKSTLNDYKCFATAADCIDYIKGNKQSEKTFLIKGSNSMKMTSIVEFL